MALADNLIREWRMEETGASARVDSVAGGANNLTASGSPGTASGIIGNGVDLVAGSSHKLTGTNPIAGLSAFTVSWWIKRTSAAGGIFSDWNGVADSVLGRLDGSGFIQFLFFSGGNLYGGSLSGAAVSTSAFTHFVATWDGSLLKAYFDGSLTDNLSASGATVDAGGVGSFAVGGPNISGSEAYITAVVDLVQVWDRPISDAEVTSLYNGGAGIELASSGSPQSIDLGQASETDTAQPVSPSGVHDIGQASETDTAQSVSVTSSGVASGITAYWKLDESSGTRADTVGSNNLTSVNSVSSAAGKLGNAASFTFASSQKLTGTNPLAGLAAFTVTAWIYRSTGADGAFFADWNGSSNSVLCRTTSGGRSSS